MTTISPDERADYAETMYHQSLRVIGSFHDPAETLDDFAHRVDEAITLPAPPGIDPVHALVAVLAAQIDPNTTAIDRLGWMTHGPRALWRRPDEDDKTLAALEKRIARAQALVKRETDIRRQDEEAPARIAAAVSGDLPLRELRPDDQLLAVQILVRRHFTTEQIAERLQTSKNTVTRRREEFQKREAAAAAAALEAERQERHPILRAVPA